MLGAISGEFSRSPRSNASRLWCTGPGSRKVSVEPHQIHDRPARPRRPRASARCPRSASSARSIPLAPDLTYGPSSLRTNRRSKTAGMGRTAASSSRSESRSAGSRTPAFLAAVSASSSKTSHAANERSSIGGSRAKSRMSGVLPSGPPTQADGAHLGYGTDRRGEALSDRVNPGDERRADGPEAGVEGR